MLLIEVSLPFQLLVGMGSTSESACDATRDICNTVIMVVERGFGGDLS